MTHTITHETDPHMGGMAHVIRRDGEYVGAAMTREGAEDTAHLIELFGYFDPTEPRQRSWLRSWLRSREQEREAERTARPCPECGHPMMQGPLQSQGRTVAWWCANCHHAIPEEG